MKYLVSNIEDDEKEPQGSAAKQIAQSVLALQKHAEEERIASRLALQHQAKLIALSASIGEAITKADSLQITLQGCAEVMVKYLEPMFARIWTLNEVDNVLELQASAGVYTHLNGRYARIPLGELEIGVIGQERAPFIGSLGLEEMPDQNKEWTKHKGKVFIVGHPLLIEDRLIGVIAVYSQVPLGEQVLSALESNADSIAIGIARNLSIQALSASEAKYRNLFENASDLIQSIKADGSFAFVNNSWHRVLGYTPEELKSLSLFKIVDLSNEAYCRVVLQQVVKGQSLEKVELQLITKEGRLINVEGNASPLAVDGQMVASMILRDMTDYKRSQAALKAQAEELKRSNADLEQFAAVASHDLQEPLRGIAGCLQILEKKYKNALDEEANQLIDFSVQGSLRMRQLINSLLLLSRVNSKPKDFKPVNLAKIINQVLANLQASIKESGAIITYDVLPTIMADETQLIQLFQNLIANAIKFCQDKSPSIYIRSIFRSHAWVISIKDNGIGFSQDRSKEVFMPFKRLHAAGTYQGNGIGLAICKKIVERHGGQIRAKSQVGKGSTFYLSLPGGNTSN